MTNQKKTMFWYVHFLLREWLERRKRRIWKAIYIPFSSSPFISPIHVFRVFCHWHPLERRRTRGLGRKSWNYSADLQPKRRHSQKRFDLKGAPWSRYGQWETHRVVMVNIWISSRNSVHKARKANAVACRPTANHAPGSTSGKLFRDTLTKPLGIAPFWTLAFTWKAASESTLIFDAVKHFLILSQLHLKWTTSCLLELWYFVGNTYNCILQAYIKDDGTCNPSDGWCYKIIQHTI